MRVRGLRPVAFLLAMLGFGLRLDTAWQHTGTLLLLLAAGLGAGAIRPTEGSPFVRGDDP